MKTTKILTIFFLFFLLAAGQAWATNTWNISQSTNGTTTTFTISRSGNTSIPETVRYKTVSITALDGVHFTGKNGTLDFGAGETQKTVTITEKSNGQIPLVYRYGFWFESNNHFYIDGRIYYRFEVDDFGGNELVSTNRVMTDCGLYVQGDHLYKDKVVSLGNAIINDQGYSGNEHKTANTENFFTEDNILDYLKFVDAEFRLWVEFDAVEEIDGYEYVQILVNNTEDCDGTAHDGDPGTINKSRFMAGFSILGDAVGWSNTPNQRKFEHYTFPHPNYGNNCGIIRNAFYKYASTGYADLMQQYFNPADCRSDNGRIIIPADFQTVTARFDASGYEYDRWMVKDFMFKVNAVDSKRPTVLGGKEGIRISGGRHTKGNTMYVSIPFNEIVRSSNLRSSWRLKTTWGDFAPVTNDRYTNNVMCFAGTISTDATGNFRIIGLEGAAIIDVAGNAFEDTLGTYGEFDISLDEDYTYSITYDLAGGSVATDNPTTYQYVTPAFTLTNPTRTGYFFDGWTGSNGNTPQTAVTIERSVGDLTFTANWTDVWGMAGGADGSEQHPYTITSTKGLELLAAVVEGLYENVANPLSGQYFVLDDDIAYTYTHSWDNINSNESNCIPIGDNTHTFLGTFDGQSHTISGLRLYAGGDTEADNNFGLFGVVGAGGVVRRVNLADARITGRNHVGALVGDNAGTVEDCTLAADVAIHNTVSGTEDHGAVTGRNSGTVQRCVSQAIVTSTAVSSNYGSFAGTNTGNVMDCLAIESSVFDANRPGIIVGYNNNGVLQRNYYVNCTVGAMVAGIGTCSGDVAAEDGAVRLFRVTAGEHVTVSGTVTTSYADTDYYKAGTVITLGCNVPGGFVLQDYYVTKDGTNPAQVVAVINDGGVYRFTLPTCSVTVEAILEATSWSGSGTENDPYIILYSSQLNLLANNVNNLSSPYLGKYFKLGADIVYDPGKLDANGENYAPVGRSGNHYFGGVFDGAGHTVRGIRINKTGEDVCADGCLGLFGYVIGGTVKNVTVTDATITGFSEIGGIVGRLEGSGVVSNCHVTSSVTLHAENQSTSFIGGIVGNHLQGSIEGCTSSVQFSGDVTHILKLGGIAGQSSGTIINCLTVHVSLPHLDEGFPGAIVGFYEFNNQTTLGHNYYNDISYGYISEQIGVGDNNTSWRNRRDITDNDGAVPTTSYTSKPVAIGAETASYPYGGITAYDRGLYYDGTYYLARGMEGASVAFNLVEGTKDGVTAWWGTFYDSSSNYSLSEGAAAYTMDSYYNLYLVGNDGSIIPKGVAVVIVSAVPGASYAPAGDADLNLTDNAPGGNILLGSDSAIIVTEGKVNGKTPYVLGIAGEPGVLGFHRFAGNSIPAHKAYYPVP